MKLVHLWVVHYTLENDKKVKCKFFTFDGRNGLIYQIKNESIGLEKVVTKTEGNNYYLSLLNYDKKAVVNKIC